jgi:hypothetical protein
MMSVLEHADSSRPNGRPNESEGVSIMFESTKSRIMGAGAGLALIVGSLGGVAIASAQTSVPPTQPPAVTQPAQAQSGSQTAPDTGAAAKESTAEAPETANGKAEASETATDSANDPAGGLRSQVQQTGQFDGQF